MNDSLNTPESMFRLLVPATDATPPGTPFVELCGSPWVLAEYESIAEAPAFTCVSYSWGRGRMENMLEGGVMSDRTIPAIETIIKAAQVPEYWTKALMCAPRDEIKERAALSAALAASQAIWIDALCAPSREPARTACLRSMGAIYSSAAQVFAVLSEPCAGLLRQIDDTGRMKPEEFFVLEGDAWISRAWTYQEMANSKSTLFVAEGDGSVLILAQDFLNAILTDTTDYAAAKGFSRKSLAVLFPHLESLQEMFAEHRIAEHAGRPAYQAMSAMHFRISEQGDDRIHAMMGVMTNGPSVGPVDANIRPAEYFMQVCEAKGDYSFMYCVAPRCDIPGRGWRPVADKMQPVLAGLLATGSGLSGSLRPTHLQMDNMCRMKPSRLNPIAKVIGGFLLDDVAIAILERLRQKGFTGCGQCLELENGYFFPQSSFKRSNELFVVTSHDVVWQDGGPGLLLRSNGTDINQFCDVGVFIGSYPKTSESINVG